MNLILIDPNEVSPRGDVALQDHRAAHIREVLNGREGQSLRVGLLNGPTGTGMIRSVRDDEITLRCVFGTEPPLVPQVDLLLALPRPKVMKRLWAPLAAMGIGQLFLVNAQKVERYYFDSHVLDPEFYQPRIHAGLVQAMDTRQPKVRICRQLKPFIEDELDELVPKAQRLVADPAAEARIASVVEPSRSARVLMAIGPEGGWSTFELDLLREHGFQFVGLGPRILRTDTACVALLALVNEALREA